MNEYGIFTFEHPMYVKYVVGRAVGEGPCDYHA